MNERIAVVGLGYVGLPVAVALSEKFPDTIAFDIKAARITSLLAHYDETSEISADELKSTTLTLPQMLGD